MPIVDIELVCASERNPPEVSTAALARALGAVFGSAPGRTWVKVRFLAASCYAENESDLGPGEWPTFVTVLHAHPPQGEALAEQVRAVTQAVADGVSRPFDRVHVQYAPPGAGRQAFGGELVG